MTLSVYHLSHSEVDQQVARVLVFGHGLGPELFRALAAPAREPPGPPG
jgi:hypothetical protein